MSTHLLLSTVLMALLLGAIFVGLSKLDRLHRGTADLPAKRSGTPGQRIASTVDTPAGLGTIFVVLAIVAGVLGIVASGGLIDGLPNAFALIVGFLGMLLTGFLFLGSYVVSREHGLGHAQGIAAALFGVGGVAILLVAANLVFGIA